MTELTADQAWENYEMGARVTLKRSFWAALDQTTAMCFAIDAKREPEIFVQLAAAILAGKWNEYINEIMHAHGLKPADVAIELVSLGIRGEAPLAVLHYEDVRSQFNDAVVAAGEGAAMQHGWLYIVKRWVQQQLQNYAYAEDVANGLSFRCVDKHAAYYPNECEVYLSSWSYERADFMHNMSFIHLHPAEVVVQWLF